MKMRYLLLLALILCAGSAMAQEHEMEDYNPWNIELSSTVPIASGFDQTTTFHFGREIGLHADVGLYGAWVGKDWSEKKEQFYGIDAKYFFHSFEEERKVNFYVSLGVAYNTEKEEGERINSIRYGFKLGADIELGGNFSLFAETGQDLIYTPDTELYEDDLSGLLLIGVKYDF